MEWDRKQKASFWEIAIKEEGGIIGAVERRQSLIQHKVSNLVLYWKHIDEIMKYFHNHRSTKAENKRSSHWVWDTGEQGSSWWLMSQLQALSMIVYGKQSRWGKCKGITDFVWLFVENLIKIRKPSAEIGWEVNWWKTIIDVLH